MALLVHPLLEDKRFLAAVFGLLGAVLLLIRESTRIRLLGL